MMGLQPCTATVDFWFYTFAGPVRESESSSLTALTTLTTLFVLLSFTLALHNWDVFMCAHSLVLMSHVDLLESILWAFEQNLSLKSWTLGSSSSFPSSKETMWTWAPSYLTPTVAVTIPGLPAMQSFPKLNLNVRSVMILAWSTEWVPALAP